MTAALTISGTLALALLPGAMEPETHFTRCWTVAVDSGEVFPTPERTPFTGFTELPDGRIAALNRDDAVLILDGSGSPLGSFQVQEKGLFPASNGILALGPADGPSLLVSVYRAGLKFFRPDGTWLATRPIAGFPVAGPMSFGTRGAAVLTSHDVFYLFSPSGRLLAREEMPFGAAFGGLATGPGRRIAIAGHAGRIRVYRWKARRLRLESEVELGDEISEPPAFGPDGSLYAITTREEWETGRGSPSATRSSTSSAAARSARTCSRPWRPARRFRSPPPAT